MSQIVNADKAEAPVQADLSKEATAKEGSIVVDTPPDDSSHADGLLDDDAPTEEELQTLRRVSGHIKWSAYTVAFCELTERFSYYGSNVLYTNFVVQPLPPGSNTGAGHNHGGQSGALGLGSRAGQGISLTNQFFAYVVPLFG